MRWIKTSDSPVNPTAGNDSFIVMDSQTPAKGNQEYNNN